MSRGNCELNFEPLNDSHFPLIHIWFNKSHVQPFYSLRFWTLDEVRVKLTPYLQNQKQVQAFVIYCEKDPIGYIQYYPLKHHPWENQNLSEEIIQNAAGFDLFIGEKRYLRKGLGSQIIEYFLEKYIWPSYQYCLADPDIRNEPSIKLFEKCGFIKHKEIESQDALNNRVKLQLFIRERPVLQTKL